MNLSRYTEINNNRIWITVILLFKILGTDLTVSYAREDISPITVFANKLYELSKSGGIINAANTPEEHLHNAKIYELRGDLLNARKSYEEFIKYNMELIDPVVAYARILLLTEGSVNGISIYKYTTKQYVASNMSYELALSTFFNDGDKARYLQEFIQKYPNFIGGYYLLLEAILQINENNKTIKYKNEVLKHSNKIIELNNNGELYKWFIHKEAVTDLIEKCRLLKEEYKNIDSKIYHDYKLEIGSNNQLQLKLIIRFPEKIKEFKYRFKYEDNKQSEVFIGEYDGEYGYVNLDNKIKSFYIELYYTDMANNKIGPDFTLIDWCIVYSRVFKDYINDKKSLAGLIDDITNLFMLNPNLRVMINSGCIDVASLKAEPNVMLVPEKKSINITLIDPLSWSTRITLKDNRDYSHSGISNGNILIGTDDLSHYTYEFWVVNDFGKIGPFSGTIDLIDFLEKFFVQIVEFKGIKNTREDFNMANVGFIYDNLISKGLIINDDTFGIQYQEVSCNDNGICIYVNDVEKNSIAYKTGIFPNDIIVKIGDQIVNTQRSLRSALYKVFTKKHKKITLLRNKVELVVDVKY